MGTADYSADDPSNDGGYTNYQGSILEVVIVLTA